MEDPAAENERLRAEISALRQELTLMRSSAGWQILERLRRLQVALFPRETSRGRVVRGLLSGIRLALARPWRDLLRRAWRDPARALARLDPDHSPDMSLLDHQYQTWLGRHAIDAARRLAIQRQIESFRCRPLISILMPVYDTPASGLASAIESVRGQLYPRWELCIVHDAPSSSAVRTILDQAQRADSRIKLARLPCSEGIGGASNRALELASGDLVALLNPDDCLTADALEAVVECLQGETAPDFLYSDHDLKDALGRRLGPMFKPDWSPDLILSMNYIAHFVVYRRGLVERVGGFRKGLEGAQDLDLILRATEQTDRIVHIPRPLYSRGQAPGSTSPLPDATPKAHEAGRRAIEDALARRGIEGEVLDGLGCPLRYRVRRRLHGTPRVSVLIPTRDNPALLRRCIESLAGRSTYRSLEILVIDNQSRRSDTLAYLETLGERVLRYNHPFDFARINNFAASRASGDHLVFLNDDTEVIEPSWIEALLEHSQRSEVGAVGAKLLFPDGKIQHAGVVVGIQRKAGHAFWGFPGDHPGYMDSVRVIRNYSAVTAACMMTRRSVFEEVGGFDEAFAISYNDVDLCLRLRSRGYLVVYTPYAVLYHHESASRGPYDRVADRVFEERLQERWRGVLENGDPYYNPNLTDQGLDFSLKI